MLISITEEHLSKSTGNNITNVLSLLLSCAAVIRFKGQIQIFVILFLREDLHEEKISKARN